MILSLSSVEWQLLHFDKDPSIYIWKNPSFSFPSFTWVYLSKSILYFVSESVDGFSWDFIIVDISCPYFDFHIDSGEDSFVRIE